MINSNYEIAIAKAYNQQSSNQEVDKFLNTLVDVNNENKSSKTADLSYENIKGITLEEIEKLFENEDEKNMAKNLRLATLFSKDENLSKALFNVILGQPFTVGFEYLTDRYSDKNSYFKSKYGNSSLFNLLHQSITNKVNQNTSNTDVISQDMLDNILLEINSFDFMSSFSKTSKDGYNKYKNKDDRYSFLYEDYRAACKFHHHKLVNL
ncbi:hypothetical protein [Aliarcobacter butzleri]|uniref:Uncharacterized protein n=1 Tax=Aliarcobacter butzleri TaxID=28197 RepID=A0AAP4UYL6_9BACT|nr:hypothetical protein [Aliarcobacter butzleri]MDN5052156.1 hypothetical protein [Aliarcobacter butzleri]MDN5075720.1 hypothetical protein [Aliarcobacter butzleri]MDN5116414.1 hypothetical protein [Aliarcobacter butzleri]MDN5132423.1 hypothetical protein [Aliarcobacter butzleri]NUW25402.1 hypothetical protein [Aliarcobacter butzleri]